MLLKKIRVTSEQAAETLLGRFIRMEWLQPQAAYPALDQDLVNAGAAALPSVIHVICVWASSILKPGDLHLDIPLPEIVDRFDRNEVLREHDRQGRSATIDLCRGLAEAVPVTEEPESVGRFVDEGIEDVLAIESVSGQTLEP
jgi:hypothetical protein